MMKMVVLRRTVQLGTGVDVGSMQEPTEIKVSGPAGHCKGCSAETSRTAVVGGVATARTENPPGDAGN